MALIQFPDVSLETLACNLVYPGQDIVESIYTGSVSVTPRGIGRWEGQFVWPQLARAQNAEDIGKIEGFIAATEGAVHVFDLLIESISESQKTRFADGTDLRLMSTERTGGSFIATLNQTSGLLVGDRITIDSRLFVVTTAHTGSRCTLSPHRALDIPTGGLPITWQQPTLRARLTQNKPSAAAYNLDWAGPWVLAFQDVL